MSKHFFLKTLLWFSVCVLWSLPALAQVDTAWVRTYNGPGNGNDLAWGVAVDGSSNVYVTGYSQGSGTNSDYATVKYDQDGDQLWVRRYNGTGNYCDEAYAIALDGSGNVFVTGSSPQGSEWPFNYDYATIKYYPNGDTAWVRRYNALATYDDKATAIAADFQGNAYVTGQSYSGCATIKYYPGGDTAWVRTFNGAEDLGAYPYAIAVDGSGNVYVTGASLNSTSGYDFATVKYSSSGNQVWAKTYDGPGNGEDFSRAMAVDRYGNVYVTGQSWADETSKSDYATIKYYSNGDTAWVRRYNGTGNGSDEARAIAIDGSGSVYVTGLSYGSGPLYEYATVKYSPNGNQLWVRRYIRQGQSYDYAYDIAVDATSSVYVTGTGGTVKYDTDGNQLWVGALGGNDIAIDTFGYAYVTGGVGDYVTTKYVQGSGPMSLVLKDGSDLHDPIANKSFKMYKVLNNPPTMTEIYKGELTTDGEGKIAIPQGWFITGDWIKVEKVVFTQPAVKHTSLLPNMYYMKLDNGKFDITTGAISYDVLTSTPQQEVVIDHSTVMFDLLVSVEWDANQQFLESLRDGFKYMSNYLYDVSDGQLYIDSLKIYDAKANWDSADVQIFASNMEWPHASTQTDSNTHLGGGIFKSGDHRLFFPRIFYFNSQDGNRNLTYDLYPYDWTIAQTAYGGIGRTYPPSRTLAHEFGHYGIGFRDEYIDKDGVSVFPDSQGNNPFDFGLMDDQLKVGIAQNSEMSCSLQYADLSHRITRQWVNRGNRSCWDYFQWNYQDTCNGIFAPIRKPGDQMFWGPNDNVEDPNYDVGSLLRSALNDSNGNAFVKIVMVQDSSGSGIGNSNIILYKNNSTWLIDQGNTADKGEIRCLGVNIGDTIRADKKAGYAQFPVTSSTLNEPGGLGRISVNNDTIVLILRTVEGNYLMLNIGVFDAQDLLRYKLRTSKFFSQNPGLEFYPLWGQVHHYDFHAVTDGYETNVTEPLGTSGMFSIVGMDDSGYHFFVNNSYTVTHLLDSMSVPEIYGPQGGCQLYLDPLNSSLEKVFILSSDFPPFLGGLDTSAEQSGEIHSISGYPNATTLSGDNNYLVVRYSDKNLKNGQESSLRIFRWNQPLSQWELVGGNVNAVKNEVTAKIQSFGVYAAFTTAIKRGDVNGDGVIDVGDVVYLINYLFKGGPAPSPLEAGDANCDGTVDVGDVVYLINYLFKGGPSPGC